MKPILTKHAKLRLAERHDRHLYRYTNEREFELSCYALLDEATESRRFLNDTRLMTELYEQHGYDVRYSFRLYKNALFVIVNDIVVTVLDTDIHSYSRQFVGSTKSYKQAVK